MEKIYQYYFINEEVIKIEYSSNLRKNYADDLFEKVPDHIIKMVAKKELIKLKKINFSCLLAKIGYNKIELGKLLCNKTYHPKCYFNLDNISENKKYLLKPASESGGKGIKIVENIKEIPINHFLQEIIEPDFIEGKKYDLRVYLLIIKYNNKKYYYLSTDGKIRISLNNYKIDDAKSVIINSSQINKDSNIFHQQLKWSYLKDYNFNEIEKITADFISLLNIDNVNNIFNIYGLDFIKDINNKYYLLEINNLPNFYHPNDSKDIKEMKTNINQEINNILENIMFDSDNILSFWQLFLPKTNIHFEI